LYEGQHLSPKLGIREVTDERKQQFTSAGFLFVIYLVTWAHQIKRREPPKIGALRMTQERSERRVRYHDPTRKARAGER